jgi:hypothetical protein
MKFNHENRIPPHISRIAFFSIPFFVMDSLVCYMYEHYQLSILLALLSVTSVAYWTSPKKMDLIKIADMSVATVTIYHSIFVDAYKYTDTYRHIYWISCTVSTASFFLNETWFMFSMILIEDQMRLWVLDESDKQTFLVWKARAQKMSVYIHMFFLHILPNITCMYCIINSNI